MGYVALKPLRWGDETIEPGSPVPAGEPGRAYDSMLRLGEIADVGEPGAESEELTTLRARVAELEATEDTVEVPEGVVPGETPGWPLLVFVAPLTEEQRAALAEAGVSGTHTPEELVDWLAEAGDGKHGDGEPVEGDQSPTADALPEGVTDLGGGWYQLADGTKAHGRKALDRALNAAK